MLKCVLEISSYCMRLYAASGHDRLPTTLICNFGKLAEPKKAWRTSFQKSVTQGFDTVQEQSVSICIHVLIIELNLLQELLDNLVPRAAFPLE